MSELSVFSRKRGIWSLRRRGGLGNAPTSSKPSDAAKAVIGRFLASERSLALLAGYCLITVIVIGLQCCI